MVRCREDHWGSLSWSSVGFVVGAMLLGVRIWRASELPKWSGVLWMGVAPVSRVAPLACLVLLVSGLALGLACPRCYGVRGLGGGNGDDGSSQ